MPRASTSWYSSIGLYPATSPSEVLNFVAACQHAPLQHHALSLWQLWRPTDRPKRTEVTADALDKSRRATTVQAAWTPSAHASALHTRVLQVRPELHQYTSTLRERNGSISTEDDPLCRRSMFMCPTTGIFVSLPLLTPSELGPLYAKY
eukprot:6924819-Prymnesium_polylepis.1